MQEPEPEWLSSTGEPDALKGASPVRREPDGKGAAMPPRRLATLLKKWPLGLSPPASFWWSSGAEPSKWQGKSSPGPEKPRVFGQQTMMTGLQRWQQRGAKDLLSHDATS